MNLKELLHKTETTFATDLEHANTLEALEKIRVEYLGRHGQITALMAHLKDATIEEKREYSPLLNALKQNATVALETKKTALHQQIIAAELNKKKQFDVTAYLPDTPHGHLHPFTHIIEKIEDIFLSMGYEEAVGPEVEQEAYNFDALNIPADHPARDMQDTFWLTLPHTLMRTHTSTVQVRTMKANKPPLAIFAPGRVFRHEATDATHDFMFMQVEGLLIDKNISMAHLCATLKIFMQSLFGKQDLDIRIRPSYFPFVEPGVEVDISCPFCENGCSICKKTKWIELGGAGLVHPHVLKFCNIDPEVYSGFAFGIGIERLAMLKYGITDIRLFRSNKLEFLKQF